MLDAKYKQLDASNIAREDRFQLISYMHVLQKDLGILLHPTRSDCAVKINKKLHGYGGELGTIPFCIPQNSDWLDFCKLMKEAENTFCANILQYTDGENYAL